jgi:hypothetical protein
MMNRSGFHASPILLILCAALAVCGGNDPCAPANTQSTVQAAAADVPLDQALSAGITLTGPLDPALDYTYAPTVNKAFLTSDGSLCVIGELRLRGLNLPQDRPERLVFVSYRAQAPGKSWQKTITAQPGKGASVYVWPKAAQSDPHGDIYLAGYCRFSEEKDHYGSTDRLILLKMSKEGDVLWWKIYDAKDYYDTILGVSFLVTESGIYLAYTRNSDRLADALILVKTDPDGALIFQNEYNLNDNDYYCGSMIETSGGDVLLAGYAHYPAIIALLLSPQGNLVWQKRYEGSPDIIRIDAAREVPDHGFVLAGSAGSTIPDAFLVKLAPDGSLVWRSRIGVRVPVGTAQGIMMEGSDFLVAYSSFGGEEQDPLFVRCTESGENGIAMGLLHGKLGDTTNTGEFDHRLVMLDRRGGRYILGMASSVDRDSYQVPVSVTFFSMADLDAKTVPLLADMVVEHDSLYSRPANYDPSPSISVQDFSQYSVSSGPLEYWSGHAWDPQSPCMKWLAAHTFGLAVLQIESGTINDGNVNFRQDPGMDAKVSTMLQRGTKVTVLNRSTFTGGPPGLAADYWYKVRTADGAVGWVFGRYLTLTYYGGLAGG